MRSSTSGLRAKQRPGSQPLLFVGAQGQVDDMMIKKAGDEGYVVDMNIKDNFVQDGAVVHWLFWSNGSCDSRDDPTY